MSAQPLTNPLLDLRDLHVAFGSKEVVRGVSLQIAPGEKLALVGESGSGKTTIGRAAVALLPVVEGKLTINGRDITGAKASELKPFRKEVGIVFQDPGSSLNPRLPVGE